MSSHSGGTRPGSRIDYLDSLRGLAALLVAYAHLASDLWERTPGSFAGLGSALRYFNLEVVDLGKVGVVLFFAISGLIIPRSLLNGMSGFRLAQRFVVTRFFRLYPLYWVSIPLGLMLPWPEADRVFSLATVGANLTMVQGFLGFENVIGAYWTLQIELVFYACCLLMALGGLLGQPNRRFHAFLASVFLALVLAGARFLLDRKFPVALPLALAVMFLGCLWNSQLSPGDIGGRRLARLALTILAVALLPICVLAYSADHGYGETWYRYLLSYGLGLALFTIGTTRVRMTSRPLVRLGVISYSVYLLHPVVFAAAERIGFHPLQIPALGAHTYILCILAATALAGEVAYRLVEAPSIAFSRRVTQWLAREDRYPGTVLNPLPVTRLTPKVLDQ
ncbi:acyltransferase family protein [Pararoseomonas indoligenes]|uniref:Acyltransferase n=1 Tax=Roseomonas indoligenes TaxID=2820811 RepID=A0A940N3S8_9PROT|nr:acyltransferase [Pararoseomonas indoligenes]MBP0496245.1 acyltransferase [Pararoseomonas indoligenes]